MRPAPRLEVRHGLGNVASEEGHKPGSNIKAPVCQTVRDRETERVATQDTLHRLMQSGYRR